MASYHIWHPAYVIAEPLTLECFVTMGDSFFLARGTDEFTVAALAAIGVAERPALWTMEPMRTHYFSSYREASDDWEDRWALVWRLRANLVTNRAPVLAAPPSWGYFDLDTADASFRANHRPQLDAGWPCLLLADAADVPILESARKTIFEAFPSAECVWGKAFGIHPELRCNLGYFDRGEYERGLPRVEEVLAGLRSKGVFVRFHDLQTAMH
jgi:hypothetical protein